MRQTICTYGTKRRGGQEAKRPRGQEAKHPARGGALPQRGLTQDEREPRAGRPPKGRKEAAGLGECFSEQALFRMSCGTIRSKNQETPDLATNNGQCQSLSP